MYNIGKDFQKKKKQALRRFSQSGKKGISPTSPGITGKHFPTRGTRGGRGRGTRGRGRGRTGAVATNTLDNPFFAAKQDRPVIETGLTGQSGTQPPTYAAAVSGTRQQQGSVPVPSFITHGPDSIPPLATGVFGNDTTNNPFLKSLQSGQHSIGLLRPPPPPYHPPPPGATPFQQPEGSVGEREGGHPVIPQAPLNTEGLFHSTASFSPAGQLSHGVPPSPPQASGMPALPNFPMQQRDLISAADSHPKPHPQLHPQPQPLPHPDNTALHVKGIPDELNNQPFLGKHFSRFGKVSKLNCYPKKRCATVVYAIKEGAILAKKAGKVLLPRYPPIQIFWSTARISQSSKRLSSSSSEPEVGSPPSRSRAAPFAARPPPMQGAIGTRTLMRGPKPTSVYSWRPPGRQAPQVTQTSSGGRTAGGSVEAAVRGEEATDSSQTAVNNPQPQLQPQQQQQAPARAVSPEKRSVWVRLGPRVGEASAEEEGSSGGLKITLGGGGGGGGGGGEGEEGRRVVTAPRRTAAVRKAKPKAGEGEEEWWHSEGEGEESDDDGDEGVYEGRDSVLADRKTGDDEMDTIARTAEHSYFLRSLTQPESFPGPRPGPPGTGTAAVGGVETRGPRPSYDLPTLTLPPPPRPKGTTAADYYEALDARDQRMRKNIVKQTSLTSAQAIAGTCPDMCPEKERYVREDRRRLSIFEVCDDYDPANPRVDHSRAIKEYSGSAADKEEPLPHELRPLGVLCMSMDYLVTMVMDAAEEGKWAEWYDFVWNRTRAIRKDITLQHLCVPECAELTEKCARFHILCAHLLCEEDISAFDPRMNNENLMKCLLSLKEFYRDIRIQKETQCPNEAEFCCYDILLHLNDGNVLNLVEQYSDEVRLSPEVHFAVGVALAVDSNNFVKFFKLVRSASFLCACIMHRYFNQVRSRGLRVLNRAHSMQLRPLPFPLRDAARMLGFESEQETAEFCGVHGLMVAEGRVQFVRGEAVQPEQAVPVSQCPMLVGSKCRTSLGEVVYGGPLPPPPVLPTPYCSFTQDTQFREPSPMPQAPAPAPAPEYSEEDVVAMVTSIEVLVVKEEVWMLVRECVAEAEQAELVRRVTLSLLEELLAGVVAAGCREAAEETLGEAARERERERERARLREAAAQSLAAELLLTVTGLEVTAVARETHRDCTLQAEASAAAVAHVTSVLVEEVVGSVVSEVCGEVVKLVKQEKQETLEGLEKQFLNRQLQRHWRRWRHMARARQHVRQCTSDIPPLPPLLSLPWQLEVLLPMEKRRRVESPLEPKSLTDRGKQTAEWLSESRREREGRRKVFYASLDLPSLLRDTLLASRTPLLPPSPSPPSHPHSTATTPSPPPNICWLALLVQPEERDLGETDAKLLEWLRGKLSFSSDSSSMEEENRGETASGNIKKLSSTSTPIPDQERQLQVAVKAICAADGRSSGLIGTSAVLLYVPTPKAGESPKAFCRSVQACLSLSLPPSPRVPLLVLCSSKMEEDHLAHWLSLRMALSSLPQASIISEVLCQTLLLPSREDYPAAPEQQLCLGLQWLAEHSPSQPLLAHTPLKEFVEQGLLKHYVPLVAADSETRQRAGLPAPAPLPLVGLYNSVLDHLAHSAARPDLRDLSWPVADFAAKDFSHTGHPPLHWNSPGYLTLTQSDIAAMRLPEPRARQMVGGARQTVGGARQTVGGARQTVGGGGEEEWSHLCTHCLSYVAGIELPRQTDRQTDRQAVVPLLSRIKSLLHHYSKRCADPLTSHVTHLAIPWDQVILACVEHMLGHMSSDQWVSRLHGNELKFTVPGVWLRAQAETNVSLAAIATRTKGSKRRRRHSRHRSDPSPYYLRSTPTVPTNTPPTHKREARVGVSPLARAVDEGRRRLEGTLKKEKALSQNFESQLQEWLLMTPPELPESQTSVTKATAGHTHDHTPSWGNSLQSRLELLRARIRTAKWEETADSIHLKALATNTS